jgi:hypothetical protein
MTYLYIYIYIYYLSPSQDYPDATLTDRLVCAPTRTQPKTKCVARFPSSSVFLTMRAAPRPPRPLLPDATYSPNCHASWMPPFRRLLPDAAVPRRSHLHQNCRPRLHQNRRPHQRQKHQRRWSTTCHSWPPCSPSRAAGTGAACAQMVTFEGVCLCHPQRAALHRGCVSVQRAELWWRFIEGVSLCREQNYGGGSSRVCLCAESRTMVEVWRETSSHTLVNSGESVGWKKGERVLTMCSP